jgi:outer membrane scaffolding protein for murein synthesis (MipA/OmpV family)
MRSASIIFCFIVATIISTSSFADQFSSESRWELGVGLGALSIPHYRGSDQRDEYFTPVPYVRYSGERLKVDREGGRYYFYDGSDVKLDLNVTFNFPVDSDENTARQGMPDLDPLLQVGPRLQWYLWQSEDRRLRLRLGAPLRVALNLSDGDNEGLFFAPYLQVRYYSNMETAFSFGPMWGSEKFHDYYYQVDTPLATASRPAYDAQEGYSGFRFTLTTSQRLGKNYWWSGFVRYDTLSGASFEDSPLVRQNDSLMAGIVFAYIFTPVKTGRQGAKS